MFPLVSVAAATQAGYTTVRVPDLPGEPLPVGIWYPTTAPASDNDIGLYIQPVAPNGPMAGKSHPLIVLSHGTGGSLEGHYDTAVALARAGFVVAAMTHTADNYRDQSAATHLADRPRAVHAVIEYMLTAWTQRAAIDPARVGMFGFSSGGFTALVAIGGVPDLALIPRYCDTHQQTFTCRLVKQHAADLPAAEAWVHDPRIKAAVIAAPAIGFTFTPSGLANIRMPVQLWKAADDHILPAPDHADAVRAALPRTPDFRVVAGADHFDFLAPCTDPLARVAPEICQEHGTFDRAAFHRDFNRQVVQFFQRTLPAPRLHLQTGAGAAKSGE